MCLRRNNLLIVVENQSVSSQRFADLLSALETVVVRCAVFSVRPGVGPDAGR